MDMFTEMEAEIAEDFELQAEVVHETSASRKLERRRRIEDLFEERRLRDELNEYEF